MTRVADGYARALFEAAVTLNCVEEALDGLKAITAVISSCDVYFNNPRTGTAAEKAALLREFMSDNITPLALEFALFLLNHDHFKYFPAIILRYRQISDFYLGKAEVFIRVPFPLEISVLERLKVRLVKSGLIPAECAENVSFLIILDKEIIGGFIAECNGLRVDASIRKALRVSQDWHL